MVWKSGRTTGVTKGKVVDVDCTSRVEYDRGECIFRNQILIESPNFSAGGDSGSAILNREREVVGLLFAGSTLYTLANHIHAVTEALGVRII